MKIDDKIREKKLQYGINKEAAKISVLPSGQIDIYEYLTVEEILFSNQSQAKFIYSHLEINLLENKKKTIEDTAGKVESKKNSRYK